MKRILALLFLLIQVSVSGQDFADDWKGFSLKNWTCETKHDTNQYLGQLTQGRLIFRCDNDPTISVEYFVFLNTDMTESFRNKIIHWEIIQSCLQITKGSNSFSSFSKQRYYYLLEPCPNCHTYNNKDCNRLTKKLKKIVAQNNTIEIQLNK